MELLHHGITRLSIEGDVEAGQVYVGRAQQLLQTLLERLRVGGLHSGAAALRLDDNAYAYARVAGSINAVRIVVGPRASSRREQPTVATGVPDFVSGVVTNGRLRTVSDPLTGAPVTHIVAFYPTSQTAQTHLDLTAHEPHGMERLAVRPHASHPEWEAPENSSQEFSQYVRCRATLYSGRMKRLVQALMGFGRQPPNTTMPGVLIPTEGGPVAANRTRSIYARVFRQLAEEAGQEPAPTDYEREVVAAGLQIRYDYRWMRTHGIHVADDGQLWLIEVSMTRGVLAMPLPVHELTRRPPPPKLGEDPKPWRFREALEAIQIETGDPDNPFVTVRDEDGIRVLEEFGGFPTGESLPDGEALESAIRAGEVLRLMTAEELDPFYRHSFYSSALGWAFSESGREAHNTGYRFEDSEIGYQIGVHYAIQLSIGASSRRDPAAGTAAVLERVNSAANVDGALLPILRRKALRLSEEQASELLRQNYNDADFIAALDALTVQPIATGAASLRLQREGYLVNPGKAPFQQIKFYEPLMGFLLSHDFHPANGDDIPPARRCDTTMHVFFAGEELKWVRYFFDPQQAPTQVEDDSELCMYQGAWTRVAENGPREVTRGFYTSDFDDRALLGGSRTTTHWKGEYVGPTEIRVTDDPVDARRNYADRFHTFIMRTETITESGQAVLTGIAVPQGMREAYYMAHMDYAESYSRTVSYQYRTLADPWHAEGWRCFISTAGFAMWPTDMKECPPGCDTRYNQMGFQGVEGYFAMQPRVARYIRYEPTQCSDIVDRGPWVQKCDNLDAMRYRIELPDLPATQNENIPRKARLTVRLVMGIEPYSLTTRIADFANAGWAYPRWFQKSPDDFGFVDLISAGGNAFGDSIAAAVDRDLNMVLPPQLIGFPTYEGVMDGSNACFIGVV